MSAPAGDMDDDDDEIGSPGVPGGQRLDKWLWFARIVKTRTLAARLVADGKIRVNRVRVDKPSHIVKPGDVLTAAVHRSVRVLRIAAIGGRRGPASEAQALYADLTARSEYGGAVPAGEDGGVPASLERAPDPGADAGRPTKRDRRRLTALRRG